MTKRNDWQSSVSTIPKSVLPFVCFVNWIYYFVLLVQDSDCISINLYCTLIQKHTQIHKHTLSRTHTHTHIQSDTQHSVFGIFSIFFRTTRTISYIIWSTKAGNIFSKLKLFIGSHKLSINTPNSYVLATVVIVVVVVVGACGTRFLHSLPFNSHTFLGRSIDFILRSQNINIEYFIFYYFNSIQIQPILFFLIPNTISILLPLIEIFLCYLR